MAFVRNPFPEWSWSHSRDALFQECQRKYYYQYYGSHNGWFEDAPMPAQQTYRLKQMLNLYSHFGDVVHHLAEMYINQWEKKGVGFTHEELYHRTRNLMNQAFVESRDVAQWWERPKRRKMLAEMYYFKRLSEKAVEEIKERMDACLTNLLESESVRDIIHDPGFRLVEVEQLNAFAVNGNKVYVKLDALYNHEDGRWVIVDWKTGQEDERIEEQLQLYAYYLNHIKDVPLEQIEVRTEYLLTGRCVKSTVDAEGLRKMEEKIGNSSRLMKEMLADEQMNEPLTIETFSGPEETSVCRFCNFREICDVRS